MPTRILEMGVKDVGDLHDMVLNVLWIIEIPTEITDENGDIISKAATGASTLSQPSDPTSFTSYENLTEAQVVSWIEATPEHATVLTKVQAEVHQANIGSLMIKDLPWASSN